MDFVDIDVRSSDTIGVEKGAKGDALSRPSFHNIGTTFCNNSIEIIRMI
jgi:hypothetical protein